jgi:regulator of replication initiation timing
MSLTPEQESYNRTSDAIWALAQESDALRIENKHLRDLLRRVTNALHEADWHRWEHENERENWTALIKESWDALEVKK